MVDHQSPHHRLAWRKLKKYEQCQERAVNLLEERQPWKTLGIWDGAIAPKAPQVFFRTTMDRDNSLSIS